MAFEATLSSRSPRRILGSIDLIQPTSFARACAAKLGNAFGVSNFVLIRRGRVNAPSLSFG